MKTPHLILLGGALLLLACGKQESTTPEAQPQSLAQEAPAEQWLEIRYDDLRLRETPGKNGAVLLTLKSGTRVKDLGETTKELETVVLRGQHITAPWGKVETTDGKQGWIFLGALGPAEDPAVQDYLAGLRGLAGGDCNTIRAATDMLPTKMNGKPAHAVDQAVPHLEAFMDSIVAQLNQALYTRPDNAEFEKFLSPDSAKASPKAKADMAAWRACGLRMIFPEGIPTLEMQPGYIIPTVGPVVTESMRTYLEQWKQEQATYWAGDGGLAISPLELAKRAVFWDEFLMEHPTSVKAPDLRHHAFAYATALLGGLDNTPSLGYDAGGTLDPEFKEAYDWVLKDHPKTETGRLVKEWTGILASTGWKRSSKTDAYLTKLYQ